MVKVHYKLETLTMKTCYIKRITIKHLTPIRQIIERTKSRWEKPLTFQRNFKCHANMYN